MLIGYRAEKHVPRITPNFRSEPKRSVITWSNLDVMLELRLRQVCDANQEGESHVGESETYWVIQTKSTISEWRLWEKYVKKRYQHVDFLHGLIKRPSKRVLRLEQGNMNSDMMVTCHGPTLCSCTMCMPT